MVMYTPPTGSTDPNADYVGKNLPAGLQGSKVPRMAIQGPLRELDNLIRGAGLSPTNEDLSQVLDAVRLISANEDTILTPVALTVHGPGADFSDLISAFAYLSKRRIAQNGFVTLLVGLGIGGAKLNYSQDIIVDHPDGHRIRIAGQALLGPLPAPTALAVTGTGGDARASDRAANLGTLRGIYRTEIAFNGGCGLRVRSRLSEIADTLFTSDGSGQGVDNIVNDGGYLTLTRVASIGAQARGISTYNGYTILRETCLSLGNNGAGCASEFGSGTIIAGTVGRPNGIFITLGNGGDGFNAANGSTGYCAAGTSSRIYARGNAGDGCVASNNSYIEHRGASVSSDNASAGFKATNSSEMECSTCVAAGNQDGFVEINNAHLVALNTSGANTRFGYFATNEGGILRTGGTATGGTANASPAVGAVGNNNASIS